MFFSSIGAELLRICRATTDFDNFIPSAKLVMDRMKKQGADSQGITKILQKMLGRHQEDFTKFNKMVYI